MLVKDTQRISIMGAGLAGTLLAVMLAKKGFRVDLFERNPDQRKQAVPAGRSINLALAERGRHPLKQVGLLDAVDQFTIPMRGRILHDLDGNVGLQPYGKTEEEVIYSVHRARLNTQLLDAAEATGRIRMYFNHKLVDIDWDRNKALFQNDQKGSRHEHPFEILIGADGVASAVRKAMVDGTNVGVSESLLEHGYKELTIPPDENGDFRLDPNGLHIWPRGGFMLIALPNTDGSFTVTLFLSKEGHPGFEHLQDWSAQKAFMESQFPDAIPHLRDMEEDFRENPVGILGTIRCEKWHVKGRVLLIGDAAHAIVPFHGQGMNAAFEDCSEFIECIGDEEQSWEQVFEAFQNRRIDNANAIADMALENYITMRDSVRDPGFLLRKSVEHELERRFPDYFIGRYSQVMFHRLPYAEVYQRGLAQADLLDKLLADAESLEDIDMQGAEQMIKEQLNRIY